jgi:hypothetical protein
VLSGTSLPMRQGVHVADQRCESAALSSLTAPVFQFPGTPTNSSDFSPTCTLPSQHGCLHHSRRRLHAAFSLTRHGRQQAQLKVSNTVQAVSEHAQRPPRSVQHQGRLAIRHRQGSGKAFSELVNGNIHAESVFRNSDWVNDP